MKADEVESTLRERGLGVAALEAEDWIAPAYQGLSIANLPSTIAALLGVSLPGALPTLPTEAWRGLDSGLCRVILVILDGLGYNLLRGRWAVGDGESLAELASRGTLVPLTSVFPSTTDAALTSLQTGVAPGTHGWLAWEMYLREMGMAVNGVLLCPIWSRQRDLLLEWGLDPETLVTAPTLAMRLAEAGVRTVALASRQFEGSGFSRMLYRGVSQMWGHSHASDFWTALRRILHETRGQRAFVSAYWSGLDTIGHNYGPGSEQWQAEFRTVCRFLDEELTRRLTPGERESTLLLITADHGQILVPPDRIVTADEDAELSRNLLSPVLGENRAAFLHARPGRADVIRDYLASTYPSRFHTLCSREVLDSGLMGLPVGDETYSRAGDLLVLARGRNALQRTRTREPILGKHGGLSADEMIVPLIAARLDRA